MTQGASYQDEPKYSDDDIRAEGGRSPPRVPQERMKALETTTSTSYSDRPLEERHHHHHHDASYIEEGLEGKSGVMRNDAPSSSRSVCHPMNKWICLGGLFFVVLALAAGVSVKNNNKSSDGNNDNKETNLTPSAATTFVFEPASGIITVPTRSFDSFPPYIRPAKKFGHIVAVSDDGDQFAAGVESDPKGPASHYGGFDVYGYDTGFKISHQDFLYEEAPNPLPNSAMHYQAASWGGGRFAFTQGRQVAIYYSDSPTETPDFRPLNEPLKDFGPMPGDDDYDPTITYYCVHMVLSPGGLMLGVLLGNNGNKPGRIEIFADQELHGGVDIWKRIYSTQLSTPVDGGTLSFDMLGKFLVVGAYREDSSAGQTVESMAAYKAPHDINNGKWTLLSDPKPVAHVYFGEGNGAPLGGSVLSLTHDGRYLAVGSKDGILNKVVVLKWDEVTGVWDALGTNNAFEGESSSSRFGASVEIGVDEKNRETRLFVGAPGSRPTDTGKVFLYRYDAASDEWAPFGGGGGGVLQSDQEGDQFGASISANSIARYIMVGMPKRSTQSETTGAFATYALVEVTS